MYGKQGLFSDIYYGAFSTGKIVDSPLPGTKGNKYTNENFLYEGKMCALFLECFLCLVVLKIIHRPKRQIWGEDGFGDPSALLNFTTWAVF